MNEYLAETRLPVLWGLHPEVDSLGHGVDLLLVFKAPPGCLPQQLRQLTFPAAGREDSTLHGVTLLHSL